MPGRLAATLAILLASAAGVAQAAPAISDAQVRAFLARQDRAWNAGDLPGYFATFAPDAAFVDQAKNPRGGILPYGRSTLSQAKAQARRNRQAGKRSRQQTMLERLEVAEDGRSAKVVTRDVSQIEGAGPPRRACAIGEQTLSVSAGRLLSHGVTETAVRCPKPGATPNSAAW